MYILGKLFLSSIGLLYHAFINKKKEKCVLCPVMMMNRGVFPPGEQRRHFPQAGSLRDSDAIQSGQASRGKVDLHQGYRQHST